ncbi:multidrug resistance-associated ABC transporter [Punctularia strigosozonata HHB-11173 SS5]|uniref:multidrug resistance-associated ABC transporter n=1 Tax=Punctularia strigosozonata (strain HHB-11173) TaxID=741275 RepID=UPI0004416792|nr:multidrug resistance-associated ABC transporter [Punctularia strigosozonata HHB-11173 SS5]EIN06055.1 multidrug resistance-associated ABC transporter [Punctularia strigosozonata HHB-11173 SS5]
MHMGACRDREGWKPVSDIRNFDLTPCFEEGILLSTLLVALLVLAIGQSWRLRSLSTIERSRRSVWILRAKLWLLCLATITSLANLICILVLRIHVPVYQSYLLEVIALAVTPALTYYNHTRTHKSSAILLLFWPFYIASLGIWTRTTLALDHPVSTVAIGLRWGVAGVSALAFALECLGPESLEELREKEKNANPLVTANVFSIWSFGWLTPLMKKGTKQYITEDDLPALLPRDESSKLGDDLHNAMQKHKGLWTSLAVAYGGPYAVAAGLKIIQDCLAFLQPQFLRWILAYMSDYQQAHSHGFSETGPSPIKGFSIAALMFVAATAQTVILNQYFQRCFETGMRVRAGLVSMIYKKALIVSSDERGRSSGDIVNLMSVDATRLQDLCTFGLIAISGPLQITLAFISLYDLLGWSAFVGVAIMIFSIPLNTFIARFLKRLQEQQMKNRDKRTRLMSELLANIRSIKLYAWEHAFIRRILQVRNDEELRMLRKIGIATSLNMTLWSGIPLLVAFSSFAVASVTSPKPLTSDIIFPAISLFMLLQFPLAMFAQVTSNIIEAMVSVRRLSDFLHAEELQPDARKRILDQKPRIGEEVLSISHGEFTWSKQAVQPTLEDINLTVKRGELVGVLGRVGAGKTSLLSAIIGDMRRMEGEVMVRGSVAYAPQNAWIMSATIRDNILFSHTYDETFYNLVLDACALRPDLALLAQGDLTEVGEKGITLSGGQRARVALARAVYARADLTLLDDVLAALDSHVARHVFDQVIGPKGLLSTKARVLVTNSVTFLRYFDQIMFIRRGIVLESGSYVSLMANSESEIAKLVRGHGVNLSSSSSGASTPRRGDGSPPADDTTTLADSTKEGELDDRDSVIAEKSRKHSFGRAQLADTLPVRTTQDGPSKEHIEQGRVKREVYLEYIKAASKTGFTMFMLAIVLQQVLNLGANITLSFWGGHNRESGSNADAGKYLLLYGVFSLSATVISGAAYIIIWVMCSIRSSKHLHDRMLYSVMRAPLSFFEQTPTGRILNLFSRDTYVVDSVLARMIMNLVRTFFVCVGIVAVIGYTFPPFLIAVPPLAYFYYRVMIYYLATSRELKRLDATSRSPIFAWFSESLNGLSTIRAFDQQAVFIANNQRRVDRNQICYQPSISVNRWLSIRLEFVGAVIIVIVALLALTALFTTGVDPNIVGLVLSYALNTTGALNWVVRSASEVEQNIVSVERILHYCGLESEAPEEIPETKPPFEWPIRGEVAFRDYSLRYRPDLDCALKNITLTTKPAEKIGICGRTGAGKSTLLLALFRILEPATGTIYIDGVDITKQGLHDLRSAISIVPQSPDLFEGTMRENVDPTGAHSDDEIWTALSQAHLKEYISSLPGGLDAPVSEGGSSLSSGQRQLLCFARALLRKTKILVLDEATSAVDLETDQAIQEIIRGPQFADVTMFIIAHRLNTIMHSDRVLVLDQGKIAEFDSPKVLLENKNSVFYSLAAETGLV